MLERSKKDLREIPLLSTAAVKELFNFDSHMTKFVYIYDPQRAQRHMNARVFMQALYHVGAVLINTGLAYSSDKKLLSKTIDGNIKEYAKIAMINNDTRNHLLAYYHSIQPYQNKQYHSCSISFSNNPFHALFVMKVALDHLPAETIATSMENLLNESGQMTFSKTPITFPDNSCMVGDHAACAVLACYILNNRKRFENKRFENIDDLHRRIWREEILGEGTKDNPEQMQSAIKRMNEVLSLDVAQLITPSTQKSEDEKDKHWFGNFGKFNILKEDPSLRAVGEATQDFKHG